MPLIQTENLTKVYGTGDTAITALDHVSLSVDAGECVAYLKSTRIEDGLLINFGSYRFQIKKYILSHERTQRTQGLGSAISPLIFAFSAFFGG